jgi:hypothetical protein
VTIVEALYTGVGADLTEEAAITVSVDLTLNTVSEAVSLYTRGEIRGATEVLLTRGEVVLADDAGWPRGGVSITDGVSTITAIISSARGRV